MNAAGSEIAAPEALEVKVPAPARYRIAELPSSSPAHTMSFDMKLTAWSALRAEIARR